MKFVAAIILALISLNSAGQTAPGKYWVQFTDKLGTPYSTLYPEDFLSRKAIDRRVRQGIPVVQSDLPVSPDYVQQVLDIGDMELIHSSKWFNAITIYTDKPRKIGEIADLPFVNEVKSVRRYEHKQPQEASSQRTEQIPLITSNGSRYGFGFHQIDMIRGHLLHELGFRGKGMHIAVLDAGFWEVQNLHNFENAMSEGRIIQGRDVVNGDNYLLKGSTHGTAVLSIMASWWPDTLVGTAPEATYILFRTENSNEENLLEEDNWVVGAEIADSMGVDIFNTSLGYSEFDDSTMNHSYYNMDGNSSRIAIASRMAAEKGILVVTSAGNSGDDAWHFITTPGDAEKVLTVGAVDSLEHRASFSAFGPTYDGRIKPEVVAQGKGTWYVNTQGEIKHGNGTSFSSPVIAGMSACLWQAHPDKSSHEIREAIISSSNYYLSPSDSLGYGVPDFWKAHLSLLNSNQSDGIDILIYPNPFQDSFVFQIENTVSNQFDLRMYDMSGREVAFDLEYIHSENTMLRKVDFQDDLGSGMYVLEIQIGNQMIRKLLEKFQ